MTWSTRWVRASIRAMENSRMGTRAMSMGRVKVVRAKNSLRNSTDATKAASSTPNKAPRRPLNGVLILNSMIKPVKQVSTTAKVDMSWLESPKGPLRAHSSTMLAVMVKAAGMLCRMTFKMNLPRSLSLLGSKARMKEGVPMVKVEISVCCTGWKG